MTKQSQINLLCSTQLSLFQRNNMVNLCICSMQVHQSRFSLFFLSSFLPSPIHPQWLFPHARTFARVPLFVFFANGAPPPLLDSVLRLVVVHGLLSLSEEGVHALVGAQEPVHAHDGLEGQDAAETGGGGGQR